MVAIIRQYGKCLFHWGAGSAKRITPHIEKKASTMAAKMLKNNKIERGFYDLEVANAEGVADHRVEIV